MSKTKRDKITYCDEKISLDRLTAIITFLNRNKSVIKIKELIVIPKIKKGHSKWLSFKLKFTFPHEDDNVKYGIRARFYDVLGLSQLEDKSEGWPIREEGGKSDEQEEKTKKTEKGE